ncbi:class I SAM-dependent methyltransferase [Sandaracinobacteroides saxicola]|uniref:Methyltransferase domain-containing protein n=1 Tax=Sandaracinobacteroides saxicola TaxID=2759707 RepID=A0A7G5IH19_9SPHN|nr:class I SAM-dependent methyltransferase [Sandaracinobacteroides saxicola]QMW22661.1 methyltransferase domain-containing protein [Sandaracinobacteroides saxicola]
MDLNLKQPGRAAMDFMVSLTAAARPLAAAWASELAAAGVTAQTLPDDLDARHERIHQALAHSRAFAVSSLAMDFASVEHGRVATAAFEDLGLEPTLAILEAKGPAAIETREGFVPPDYYRDVWFHRTTGGWDGHPQQGLIHGELIHRHYVAKNFPGDIFAQRRRVLAELPRRDYTRIFEMGSSSGHFTQALAETFPAAHITGCDISLPMLRQALRTANAHGWPWRLIQCAAEDSGLPDASFDLVTSYIILHEMPRAAIAKLFAEAFRLLEPGGHMLMSDVTPYAAQDRMAAWRADWLARHGGEPWWRESATTDLAALARDAGFIDVQSRGIDGALYPWITMATKPA